MRHCSAKECQWLETIFVLLDIFKTFLCLLSVSKDTKLSHSQNIYIDQLSFALWCSIDYILKLMKKMTDKYSTFCNKSIY